MKNTLWSDAEIQYLIDHYQDMTNLQMANALERSKCAVDLKLNKMGIKKSKYKYNVNYFNKIDSNDKAYWLGFFYADGYTIVGKNQHGINAYEAGIELQVQDINHLKCFNRAISGNIKIRERVRQNYFDSTKQYHSAYIRLYNKTFVENLIKQGVTPNKSLIVQFPTNVNAHMSHFIRGYYDGNGCIARNKRKDNSISCDFTSGSLDFLLDLRATLFQQNIHSYISQEKNNVYRLFIRGMHNVDQFCEYIYQDATCYLLRKYKKACFLWKEYSNTNDMPLHSEMGGFLNWRKNLGS